MKSTNKKLKRPPGRPRTGIQPPLSTRVPKDVFARVEQWAEANGYTRSVAVAKLIEHGLDVVARRRVLKRKGPG